MSKSPSAHFINPTLTILRGLMIATLAALIFPGSEMASGVELVKNGEAVAKIYVHPEDVAPVERMRHYRTLKLPSELDVAIEDFNYHLEKMTGARLEVVNAARASEVVDPAVVFGRLAVELGAKPEATEWQEGYRIMSKGGRVLIGGERMVAASYGGYHLLNILGCHWVMPGPLGEVIPESKTVVVADMDLQSHPDFGLRWMWIGGHPKHFQPGVVEQYEQWRLRQRMGVSEMFQERLNEAHMWNKLTLKYKEEFEKDPEMLALVRQPDGTFQREGPQIETLHPGTVELGARYIREMFEEREWPKDKAITLAIGPADGLGFSESAESRGFGPERWDPITGVRDSTDHLVKYANDVLETIGDEFPNLTLGFYVYSWHNAFPETVVPDSRIRPIFAPIGYSRLHSTVDPHSKTRAYYRRTVERWAEHASENDVPLMVYEYNWNLADNMLPFTRVRSLAEDLRFYMEKGFFAVTIESIQAWAVVAPHNYIFARMAWDTSLEWETLLKEFSELAYGPAAADLERYFLRIAKIQREAGLEAGSYYSAPLIFDEEFMIAARGDLDKAAATAGMTDAQRTRLQGVEYGLRSLELFLDWNSASNSFDFAEAMKIGEAMRTNYAAAIETNPHFYGRAGGIYIDRLLLKSTEESLLYSSAPYKIVDQLPDQLPTLFDPQSGGEFMNLFRPEIQDLRWIRTRTFSSTLDAQGLGFVRPGSIWYRHRFVVPANLKEEGIGLLLGAFEDMARVWLNGVLIGGSGVKFAQPAVFDLTDAVLSGEENLLTIEVRWFSLANELFVGGIFRPSFVFAGPRVETPEPPPVRYRVLPGGGTEPIQD